MDEKCFFLRDGKVRQLSSLPCIQNSILEDPLYGVYNPKVLLSDQQWKDSFLWWLNFCLEVPARSGIHSVQTPRIREQSFLIGPKTDANTFSVVLPTVWNFWS